MLPLSKGRSFITRGGSGWLLGKIPSPKELCCTGTGLPGEWWGPGSVPEPRGCGTWGHGHWARWGGDGSGIPEVFSSRTDSVILWSRAAAGGAAPRALPRSWLRRRGLCRRPRCQQMVLKNTECSPRPEGCWALRSEKPRGAALSLPAEEGGARLGRSCSILYQFAWGFRNDRVGQQRSKAGGQQSTNGA